MLLFFCCCLHSVFGFWNSLSVKLLPIVFVFVLILFVGPPLGYSLDNPVPRVELALNLINYPILCDDCLIHTDTALPTPLPHFAVLFTRFIRLNIKYLSLRLPILPHCASHCASVCLFVWLGTRLCTCKPTTVCALFWFYRQLAGLPGVFAEHD